MSSRGWLRVFVLALWLLFGSGAALAAAAAPAATTNPPTTGTHSPASAGAVDGFPGALVSTRPADATAARGEALSRIAAEGGATFGQRARGVLLDDTGAVGAWSISGRIKAAGLPGSGPIRYVPPTNYRSGMPLPRGGSHGYIDRFGNEWVKGPSRTADDAFEWDVQLSDRGRASIGWLSRDGSHVNVSLDGWVTH